MKATKSSAKATKQNFGKRRKGRACKSKNKQPKKYNRQGR
jgi:hypothetical protein